MALHLVTGGAGFIGSSIAEQLLSSGDTVRILDDFSSGRRENLESLPGKVEVIEGSIVNPETVARAMHGVDVVFHEAAAAPTGSTGSSRPPDPNSPAAAPS